MAEELNGLELTFEKVKIPSGGGIVYEVPGADGEPDTVKDFKAVILYHHPLNCYYKTKYTGGSNPPDCGSFDGIAGIGDPGGKCKTCPLNQYESADEGKGKACKNRRRIYILREGDVFPMLLSLPTGSLKVFTKYIIGGLGGAIYALIAFVVADYITGVFAAFIRKELSSEIGAKRIIKKVTIFIVIGIGNLADIYLLGTVRHCGRHSYSFMPQTN